LTLAANGMSKWQGWRPLANTIFMKRDNSDKIIPIVGAVDHFYETVVLPRKNLDMNFTIGALKKFM